MNPQTECSLQLDRKDNMYHTKNRNFYSLLSNNDNNVMMPLNKMSEMCFMREFLSFIVIKLQSVLNTLKEDDQHEELLSDCLRLWWNQASRYV